MLVLPVQNLSLSDNSVFEYSFSKIMNLDKTFTVVLQLIILIIMCSVVCRSCKDESQARGRGC